MAAAEATSAGGWPHDSWARHYEAVMERTFGSLYDRLTSSALAEIDARIDKGSSVIDFGAGCGRLALPLARRGLQVTAVEPSPAMFEELRHRAELLAGQDPEASARLTLVHTSMQGYGGDHTHDLALCVFTVIAYMLDHHTLDSALRAAGGALRPGGLLLIDVPNEEVFESMEHDTGDIIREVSIEPLEGPLYRYRESTLIRTADGPTRYEDAFTLRRWTVDEIRDALARVGFEPGDDVEARFRGLGACYLLWRRGR